MMLKRTIATASLGVMLLTASIAAHHAFSSEFDQDKPVMLEGSLTKADWTNPHAWLYIDVKSADGKVVNWAIEMGPPNALLRRGWKKSSATPLSKRCRSALPPSPPRLAPAMRSG